MANKDLKVVNLFGSPGTGKSTTAAGLFHSMKLKLYSVELVTEYAKDLVWSERQKVLAEQDYVFAKQRHRLQRLVGKVEYAVTDSPLFLSLVYLPDDFVGRASFLEYCLSVFESFSNTNVFLRRVKPYVQAGRNETEDGSNAIADRMRNAMDFFGVPYTVMDADRDAVWKILDIVTG